MKRTTLLLGVFIGSSLLSSCKQDQKKAPQFPFFGSLKSRKVNARCGPGFSYPIEWVYTTHLLPVQILESYEHWYKIQDASGDLSWINKNMIGKLKSTLSVLPTPLYEESSLDSSQLAKLDTHVLLSLSSCTKDWCLVSIEGLKGFIPRCNVFAS